MAYKKLAALFLVLATFASADDASHRKTASELVDLAAGPESFRAGFNASIEPMLTNLRQRGAPEPAIAEMKAAIQDWMSKEIVWEELRPGLIEIYKRELTEPELKDIIAFYKTPSGKKALAKLPGLTAEVGKLSQAYAASKQATLMARLQKVAEKYQLK